MNFAEFRKKRQTALQSRVKERPTLNSQEERFLYSLRLKTMEYRTLMSTLKELLPPSQLDAILVEYNLRLRKARLNFEKHNFNYEWNAEQ
jgi:hypothetical protein